MIKVNHLYIQGKCICPCKESITDILTRIDAVLGKMKGLIMVKRFQSPQGYTVLKMSLFECTSIFKGGAGICDNCGRAVLEGYYVPVLNHYLCPKCYQDFTQRTPYYPEDAYFESYWLDYVSKRIKKLGLSLQQTETE